MSRTSLVAPGVHFSFLLVTKLNEEVISGAEGKHWA